MYKTKKVVLNKEDIIWDEDAQKFYPLKYEEHKEYFSPVPKYITDEIKRSKDKILELTEEIEELKKEIDVLKSLNEEC